MVLLNLQERDDFMLDIFMKFMGIENYVIDESVVTAVLPVFICVAAALTLYMVIVFFQFILKVLNKK